MTACPRCGATSHGLCAACLGFFEGLGVALTASQIERLTRVYARRPQARPNRVTVATVRPEPRRRWWRRGDERGSYVIGGAA